jgi:hypothetical protein
MEVIITLVRYYQCHRPRDPNKYTSYLYLQTIFFRLKDVVSIKVEIIFFAAIIMASSFIPFAWSQRTCLRRLCRIVPVLWRFWCTQNLIIHDSSHPHRRGKVICFLYYLVLANEVRTVRLDHATTSQAATKKVNRAYWCHVYFQPPLLRVPISRVNRIRGISFLGDTAFLKKQCYYSSATQRSAWPLYPRYLHSSNFVATPKLSRIKS